MQAVTLTAHTLLREVSVSDLQEYLEHEDTTQLEQTIIEELPIETLPKERVIECILLKGVRDHIYAKLGVNKESEHFATIEEAIMAKSQELLQDVQPTQLREYLKPTNTAALEADIIAALQTDPAVRQLLPPTGRTFLQGDNLHGIQ